MVTARALLALAAAAALSATGGGCSPDATGPPAEAETFVWKLPAGFPEPVVPADNPMTPAKVELGRRLFHDARLSGNGELACAGCHRPELAYTDGRARAVGSLGDEHPRSAMSLANVAYASTLGWDDPTLTSLEAQARVPLLNEHPVEMGVAGHEDEVLGRLRDDRDYRRLFERAFPDVDDPFTLEQVTHALAAFQRTLISGDSPYDRWAFHAEPDALGAEARAGAALFFSRRLACFRCHAGFNLSGNVAHAEAEPEPPRFHNTALYDEDGEGAYPETNPGLLRITGEPTDMGRFRAPTLRNVALTAPYMHDGSVPTLEAVLDHYAAGGRASGDSPLKDPLLAGFELSDGDRAALIAFLGALTDEAFLERARAQVP